MVNNHEIKQAWKNRELKRKERETNSVKAEPLTLVYPKSDPMDILRDMLSCMRDDRVAAPEPSFSMGMPYRKFSTPAFVVDPVTKMTGMRADLLVWDDEAAAIGAEVMEALEARLPPKGELMKEFTKIASATSQFSRAAESMDESMREFSKSMSGVLSFPVGGFAHGELMTLSSGRRTGKSELMRQYQERRPSGMADWAMSATVMSPEQMEKARLQHIEDQAERARIEAEREQLGYGGW